MWELRTTALGRILVPPRVPGGFAVFATSLDFEGRINPAIGITIAEVIRQEFGIDAALVTCTQIHSATVTRAKRDETWRECDACDALWSDESHVAIGIKVADCLPITMIDPTQRVIANVHSGWRGAVQRIAAETLDALERETSFNTANALAYLGPSIRSCCFEVGEEVATQFDETFLDRSRAKPHVDLIAYTVAMLESRGISADRISDSGVCTRCDGSIFHSYRRAGKGGGRNLQIVAQ
ncbi:MAG TPA: polyphenol oxidase family protein [Thermoanaerobaculia bacterium]